MRKRSKNFELFYDECETSILRLLKEYNMTFADLSREIGVRGQTIARLAYGIDAPIYDDKRRKEKVKKLALTICEYFHMDFAEVFPKYACQIQKSMEAFEIMPFQTYSELVSSEDYIIDKIESDEIFSALSIILRGREYDIFIARTFYMQQYEEIAKNNLITPTRAQQIYKRTLLKVQNIFVDGFRKDIYMRKRILDENNAKEKQKMLHKHILLA